MNLRPVLNWPFDPQVSISPVLPWIELGIDWRTTQRRYPDMVYPHRHITLVEPLADEPRLAWCQWLRRHGIDPAEVPIPTTICCWDDARTITIAVLVDQIDLRDNYARRIHQLESPALPFPTEIEQAEGVPVWAQSWRMMSGNAHPQRS